MNSLFKALYIHCLVMGKTGQLWVVKGQSLERYSTRKTVLDTNFVSIDGEVWHLVSGPRPKTFMTLVIPFYLFIKDEAEAQ